jgi:hypothetical protein
MNWSKEANLAELIGQTLIGIEVQQNGDDDRILFKTKKGDRYLMYHCQDCCENVLIQRHDDLSRILNKKLIGVTSKEVEDESGYEHKTTTTFTFETEEYTAQIVWLGESNGYYSESVEFEKTSTAF